MLKISISLFILFTGITACFAAEPAKVKFPAGTIIFERPDVSFKYIAILRKPTTFNTYSSKVFFPPSVELRKYFTFHKIKVAPDRYAWASKLITGKRNAQSGKIKMSINYSNSLWRKIFSGGIIFALIFTAVLLVYNLRYPDKLQLTNRQKIFAQVSFLILLRYFLLLILILGAGNIILFSSDEPSFSKVGLDIFNGDYAGPWKMTIGLGILYLPFIKLFAAENIFDIIIPFSWFSAFVLMPGLSVLFYFIIKKLAKSELKAFLSTLLWILLPFFCFYWHDIQSGLVKSYFALPSFDFSFRLYKSLTWTGFNAMSDTPSMFFVMLCIFLSLYLKKNLKMVLIVSAFFAFACLIRINNIFFSPLIAWLFWKRLSEEFRDKRFLLRALVGALITFIIVFLPQLLINLYQSASILNFPYIYHNGANDGFEFAMLKTGIPLLVKANLAFFTLGLMGLLSIRDRNLRITLSLWIVPSLLFFFGYKCVESDAIRFILPIFGALFAAFVCSDVWRGLSRDKLSLLILMCGLSILLVCPSNYTWQVLYPFDLQKNQWGITIAEILNFAVPAFALIVTFILRRERKLLFFCAAFIILYFSAQAWLFALIFFVLLALSVRDWSIELINNKQAIKN